MTFSKKLFLQLLVFITLFLSSCSVIVGIFDPSGIEIKIANMPVGVSDLKSGQIMTIFQKKQIGGEQERIKSLQSIIPNKDKKLIYPLAAEFNGEIRLMDFVVPEQNEKPQLGFESTARSLVFINPIFLGLKPDKRIELFKAIPLDKSYSDLIKLVADSSSLLDDKIVKTSNLIAQRMAAKIGIINEVNSSALKPPTTKTVASFSIGQFPKSVCGDSLPKDSKLYPIKFYPVFVDYSERNLQKVKSLFCRDALKVYRKKLSKDSIQVGSFVTLERARSFTDLMKQNLGNAEIGEPTNILAPRSSINSENTSLVSTNSFFESFDPPAYAQPSSIFEYKVSEQFIKDIPIRYIPLAQKVSLEALSNKLSIGGKSAFAQQVLILPSDKVNFPFRSKDYKDSDILAEYFIFPTEETNIFEWFIPTGESDIFGKRLQPKGSENFSVGNYVVAMTGGLNRLSVSGTSAFRFNLMLFYRDILGLTGYAPPLNDLAKISALSTSVLTDCEQRVIKSQASGTKIAGVIYECLTDSSNFQKLSDSAIVVAGSAIGLNSDQREKLEDSKIISLIGKFGLGVYNFLDVVDKTAQVGKLAAYGQYLAYENIEGAYTAKFEVEDKTALKEFEVDCDKTPAGQFLDLEFEACTYAYATFRVKAKNYSSDWYEVERVIKNPDDFYTSIPIEAQKNVLTATLISPNAEPRLEFDTPKGYSRRWQSNIWQAQGIQKSGTYIPIENVYMKVKRHSGLPFRQFKINCNDATKEVWNIMFVPKCRPNGIYIDVKSSIGKNAIDLNSDGVAIQFKPSIGGSSYYLQSPKSSLDITLSLRQ